VATTDYPCQRALRGIQFTLLQPVLPQQARFAFTGPFGGEETTWDATLLTLDAWQQSQPPETYPVQRHSFIEIGTATTQGRDVCIVLDIPVIDEAVILRTIIMLRQYKRLRMGRHEFGVPRVYPGSDQSET